MPSSDSCLEGHYSAVAGLGKVWGASSPHPVALPLLRGHEPYPVVVRARADEGGAWELVWRLGLCLVGGEVGLVLECRPGEAVLYARMRDGVRPSPFHTEGVRVTL